MCNVCVCVMCNVCNRYNVCAFVMGATLRAYVMLGCNVSLMCGLCNVCVMCDVCNVCAICIVCKMCV